MYDRVPASFKRGAPRTDATRAMLIGLALAACLASVPLAGGHMLRLADVRFRGVWLLLVAIVAQIIIIEVVPSSSEDVLKLVHLASYALIGAFVVANRRLAYLWVVALGGTLNFVAIAVNGGVMPARAGALAGAGLPVDPAVFVNSAVVADPKLAFLGDVLFVPSSWPASNVFSIGDVVIVVGALLLVHAACGSRLLRRGASTPVAGLA